MKKSNIKTKFVKNIDLSWVNDDLKPFVSKFTNRDYILIFPFCSKNTYKKWPYYKNLITSLRRTYKNNYSIFVAPGPNEIEEAKSLNINLILKDGKPIDIKMLILLIKKAKYIVSNDTGPAHIASHLNKKGLALFGSHTTAEKKY